MVRPPGRSAASRRGGALDLQSSRLSVAYRQRLNRAGSPWRGLWRAGRSILVYRWSCACEVKAEDVCTAVAIPVDDGDDVSMLKMALFIGFVCGVVSAVMVIWIGRKLYLAVVVGKKKEVRSVFVQSPVTYTRHRQDPRYVPLGEHAWGAW